MIKTCEKCNELFNGDKLLCTKCKNNFYKDKKSWDCYANKVNHLVATSPKYAPRLFVKPQERTIDPNLNIRVSIL